MHCAAVRRLPILPCHSGSSAALPKTAYRGASTNSIYLLASRQHITVSLLDGTHTGAVSPHPPCNLRVPWIE